MKLMVDGLQSLDINDRLNLRAFSKFSISFFFDRLLILEYSFENNLLHQFCSVKEQLNKIDGLNK